jgi:hypothetical protein
VKKVFASLNYMINAHVKNLLTNEGIASFTKNDHLASAAGEVPFNECWFEVWVAEEDRFDDAKRIVEEFLSVSQSTGPDWKCTDCGEENEYQFSACWKCSKDAF